MHARTVSYAVVAGLATGAAPAAAQPAADAAAPPLVTISAGDGLIANAFAVSADGARVAYVQLTAKHFGPATATLRIASIPSGAEVASLTGIPVPQRLAWASADRVVVIAKAGAKVRVWSVPIAGPVPTTSIGPVDRAELVYRGGTPTVVTYTRLARRPARHEIATYAPADLAPLASTIVAETGGRVDHPDGPLKPLWWSDGSATLVGRRPGPYDSQKDIRLPHQLVRLDVLSGTSIVEDIPLAGFARVTAGHAARPGADAFVYRRNGALHLVSQATSRVIAVARRGADYYAGSVHYQAIAGERLVFSATSKRNAGDPDGIELYVVDLAAGEPRQLLVVPGKQRFVRWHVAGARIAVLRTRQDAPGGPSLDIHELPIP